MRNKYPIYIVMNKAKQLKGQKFQLKDYLYVCTSGKRKSLRLSNRG